MIIQRFVRLDAWIEFDFETRGCNRDWTVTKILNLGVAFSILAVIKGRQLGPAAGSQ